MSKLVVLLCAFVAVAAATAAIPHKRQWLLSSPSLATVSVAAAPVQTTITRTIVQHQPAAVVVSQPATVTVSPAVAVAQPAIALAQPTIAVAQPTVAVAQAPAVLTQSVAVAQPTVAVAAAPALTFARAPSVFAYQPWGYGLAAQSAFLPLKH